MTSCTIVDAWLGIHDMICVVGKYCFDVIKQLMIMNHLGGKWHDWFMLSGYTGVMSMTAVCIALVDGHPGTKRLDKFLV